MKMRIKHQLPKFNSKEILEIFPEAKEIIPLKTKEYKLAVQEKENKVKEVLKKIYSFKTDYFSEWFFEEIVKVFMISEIGILEKKLFRLKRFQCLLGSKNEKNNWIKFEEKVEIARNFPIEELARSKLKFKKAGESFVSLCPFHNEKTPSFYIYPDSNRFYCFGCQEKGDVISLTMALYDLEFKEAIEMLQN